MSSITGWNRIEPHARDVAFKEGLEAPLYDAAWILARQWQIGEFRGEDAGSAVQTRVKIKAQRVTHYKPGPRSEEAGAVPYDVATQALEGLVEAESLADFGAIGWLDRAEGGLGFMRLLSAQPGVIESRDIWIQHFGFADLGAAALTALDEELREEYTDLQRTAPDGLRLYPYLTELVAGDVGLPAEFQADPSKAIDAATVWLNQWRDLHPMVEERNSAWQDDRMEYQFSLSVASDNDAEKAVLSAKEYHGGDLDWHAFDIAYGEKFGDGVGVETIEASGIPSLVDYDGMPAPRWWEFEDARVALPQVSTAPDDLIKMVLLEFALVYGSDWLIIPLELPVGSIYRIEEMQVVDSFGEAFDIDAIAASDDPIQAWQVHHLADAEASMASSVNADQQVLFLPPTMTGGLNGEARERVEFGRDEIANLALAVEVTTQSELGLPEDRQLAYRRKIQSQKAQLSPKASEAGELTYRLANEVPDFWIPFVPVANTDNQSVAFRRGAFLDPATDERVRPRGRLLVPEKKLVVEEEEISRVGMSIQRQTRLARWIGGETMLWQGRKRIAGRGQIGSGVRFDTVRGDSR